MSDTALKKIEDLYTGNLREKGLTSLAVGWNTPESQAMRFEKLNTAITSQSRPITVNDYGCGYGAHLEYLEQVCGIKVEEYNGYDLSEDMLAAARKNLSWFGGRLNLIKSAELSTTADYTFVSGTFNVRFDADTDAWKSFIHTKLDELAQYSRRGFSFNLLSTYVDWQEKHLFYGDPCYWFNHCKKRYSKRVSLLHDYPLYEWTLVVKKEEI